MMCEIHITAVDFTDPATGRILFKKFIYGNSEAQSYARMVMKCDNVVHAMVVSVETGEILWDDTDFNF